MPPKPEHAFHQTAWVYLRKALPGAYVVSIDNATGALPDYVKIARRARGVLSGQPDIRVLYNAQSIDFELKVGKNPLSNYQAARHDEIRRNGGYVFTVRSLAEIEEALVSMGLTPRVHAPAEAVEAPVRKRTSKPREPRPDQRALKAINRARAGGTFI